MITKLEKHDEPVKCVTISHDGKKLVSADFVGYLIFWNLETYDIIKELKHE